MSTTSADDVPDGDTDKKFDRLGYRNPIAEELAFM